VSLVSLSACLIFLPVSSFVFLLVTLFLFSFLFGGLLAFPLIPRQSGEI